MLFGYFEALLSGHVSPSPDVTGADKQVSPIRTGLADPGRSPVGSSDLIAIDRAIAW
jgi:hypothetical protein